MNPEKFRLSDAINSLLDQNEPVFKKTWVLARLMAWMCLDQRHGTRRRNPRTGRPILPNRQRRDAKFAGHLALASLLDRIDMNDDIVGGLYSLFLKSGGFALFLKSPRGARRWLPRMKKATTQLAYVHEIVNYLCRSEQSGGGQDKFNIECAKKFIQKTDKRPELEKLKPRTLGDYWEKHKQAAPYIFAFDPFLASAVERAALIRRVCRYT